MRRNLFRVLCFASSFTIGAATTHAQRFEGIITMKVSGGMGAAISGNRAGPGRSGGAQMADGRGAPGRGGARGGPPGRGAGAEARGAGRVGSADLPNDPRAEALRAAMAGGIQQIEYMTRRGKIRIGLGGGAGAAAPAAMIYAPEDGVVYTVFPAMSMYAEMSMNDMMAATRADTSPAATGRAAPRPPVVTHTKQFELIAGHRCEHISVTTGQQKTDVCMGKGLGVFIMPAAGRTEAWNQVMTEANGFPLKVVGADGRVLMEVTKIERKALGEALFNVPDTFTKMPDFNRRPPG
ncbi:MAG: DUF4412 domain-containing protein [Gemmatimonadaceae bacterium]